MWYSIYFLYHNVAKEITLKCSLFSIELFKMTSIEGGFVKIIFAF